MFLCKPCTDKAEGEGHFEKHTPFAPLGISRGSCESCKQVSDCVDCKCYKGRS